MHRLLAGVQHFQHCVLPTQRGLFRDLAEGQNPLALFVTCSDSRIDPNLITNTDPGDLFLVRNVGNLIVPHGSGPGDASSAAAIELALSSLDVPEIIVCGHIGCSAIESLLSGSQRPSMASLRQWLRNADCTRQFIEKDHARLSDADRCNVAVQHNVIMQLQNLMTHPTVARHCAEGRLRLDGWVYKIGSGEVYAFDPGMGRFAPLGERSDAVLSASPSFRLRPV